MSHDFIQLESKISDCPFGCFVHPIVLSAVHWLVMEHKVFLSDVNRNACKRKCLCSKTLNCLLTSSPLPPPNTEPDLLYRRGGCNFWLLVQTRLLTRPKRFNDGTLRLYAKKRGCSSIDESVLHVTVLAVTHNQTPHQCDTTHREGLKNCYRHKYKPARRHTQKHTIGILQL